MGGSMRIESARLQDQSEGLVDVKLHIEGRNDVYAYANTVTQAIARLAKNPGLPLHVREWLAPTEEDRDDLDNTNAALDAANREIDGLRRMVDLLLDRLEGRRR